MTTLFLKLVEDFDDVGMIKTPEGLAFSLKACSPIVTAFGGLAQDLDRYRLTALAVGGPVDFAHPASAKEIAEEITAIFERIL